MRQLPFGTGKIMSLSRPKMHRKGKKRSLGGTVVKVDKKENIQNGENTNKDTTKVMSEGQPISQQTNDKQNDEFILEDVNEDQPKDNKNI